MIGWRAFALHQRAVVTDRKSLGAQGHRLVQPHALAHSCGFANDDAGSMIDEETCVDFGARMNVDAGGRMRQLGDYAREQRQVKKIELMREPMMGDARDSRITETNFLDAACGGVTLVRSEDVGLEQRPYMRQARCELMRDLERAKFALLLTSGRRELQLPLDLVQQYAQRCVELVADEVVDSFFSEIGQPEVSRKQRREEPIDNFVERFARRHLDDRAVAPALTLGFSP